MDKTKQDKDKKKQMEPVTRDYTINLHRLCHNMQFKKKSPRALREIRRFVQKEMNTEDVRIDPEVNKYVWSKGIRSQPRRVRVRLNRRRNEDEDAAGKFYTTVGLVRVASFKKLQTEKARDNS